MARLQLKMLRVHWSRLAFLRKFIVGANDIYTERGEGVTQMKM